MPSRISTLNRENAIDLSKNPPFKNTIEYARQVQNEILYDNDPTLYGCCFMCDKNLEALGKKRTDHFVSAIYNGSVRFRNGFMVSTNDPINMVYCCSGKCNQESNKMKRMKESPRLQRYYDYVLQNIPLTNISEEQYRIHSLLTQISEMERLKRIKDLLNPNTTAADPL